MTATATRTTCRGCGVVRTIHGRGLCRRCFKAWKRSTDPAYAERDREFSRNWKARNRERNRQRDREYGQHPCSGCGKLVARQAMLCVDCEYERRRARYPEIQRRWLAGESLCDIALALDTTGNVIGTTVTRMRAAGWDLPYRYQRRRVGEKVRAGEPVRP